MSVDHTIQIKTYLADYTDIKHYTEVTVTVNSGECDCQYLLWTDTPYESVSQVIQTVMVGDSGTDITLPTPTPDSATNQDVYPTF